MSLFLKDFNAVVRFFPKFFFHLVASFGHCDRTNSKIGWPQKIMASEGQEEPFLDWLWLCNTVMNYHIEVLCIIMSILSRSCYSGMEHEQTKFYGRNVLFLGLQNKKPNKGQSKTMIAFFEVFQLLIAPFCSKLTC